MKFDKQQKEWLAFEFYRSFCEKRNILTYEKRESPDFLVTTQNSTVGLEVTESITEVFARISDFLTLDKMIEVLRPIYVVEKGDYRASLCELLEKKLIKLNEIYSLFKENKIFVLAPFSFLSDINDHENLQKDLNRMAQKFNILYDEIYIFTGKCILAFNADNKFYNYYIVKTDESRIKSIITETSKTKS